jgi:hypothetical protein
MSTKCFQLEDAQGHVLSYSDEVLTLRELAGNIKVPEEHIAFPVSVLKVETVCSSEILVH